MGVLTGDTGVSTTAHIRLSQGYRSYIGLHPKPYTLNG